MAEGLENTRDTEEMVRTAQRESEAIRLSIEQNGQNTLQAVEKKLSRKQLKARARAVEAAKHEAEVEAAKLEIFEKIEKARTGNPYGADPIPDFDATRQAEELLDNIKAQLDVPAATGESAEEKTARIMGQVQKDVERALRRQPVIEKHSKQVIVEEPAELPLPLQNLPVEEAIKAEVEAEIAARDAANENDMPEDSD